MINMVRVHTLLIGLLIVATNVLAQQDPQFSQYNMNRAYFNPALITLDGASSVTLFSRSQWVGYETSFNDQGSAPTTQFLNFSTPLTLMKLPMSVGANLIFDQTGPLTQVIVQPSAAYTLSFPRGDLHLGIRPALINQRLDFAVLEFVDPNDVRNTGQMESDFVVDLDLGVGYSTEDFLIGLGVFHLLTPSYDYGLEDVNGATVNTAILYNLYGEYYYQLTSSIQIIPNALIQTTINAFSYNAGVMARYNDKFWGGISYRDRDAVIFMVGYSFFENKSLGFGYSFDFIVDEQDAKATSSHEIHVRYVLPSLSTGSKKIIRTPRFRF